ncbi:hypothetical protein TNCT_268611 [Trichonephila clavata]|uniref:Uncharacterized protein n=1 Tax=Trichonephila clavata TaxID=2740835 RepID=A0A8X6GDE1_TRICU|nr:hypothetical protein TNCT_268611 [Trichonephila clavata]
MMHVLWSDESRYIIWQSDEAVCVGTFPDEHFQTDCIVPQMKLGSGLHRNQMGKTLWFLSKYFYNGSLSRHFGLQATYIAATVRRLSIFVQTSSCVLIYVARSSPTWFADRMFRN